MTYLFLQFLFFSFQNEKWPEPPAFIFMIDVSYNSVHSGLVNYICHILKNDLLNYLPKSVNCFFFLYSYSLQSTRLYRDKNDETSTVRVGFATFDKQIHFYNIKVRRLVHFVLFCYD